MGKNIQRKKIMGRNIPPGLAALAAAMALLSAARAGEFGPGRVQWRLPQEYTRIEGSRLTVEIPQAKYGATAMATTTIPAERFKGRQGFSCSVEAEAQDVAKPLKPYLGIKSQVHWRDSRTGRESWANTKPASGSFQRTALKTFVVFAGAEPDFVELQLGLQATSGRIVFDLDTLKLSDEVGFTARNPDRTVNYPECVANDCHRHGVMLPAAEPTEDDFRTLKEWGTNLVRYQMVRNWHKRLDNRDLGEFNAWLDGKLDVLEKTVLPLGRKYGQKIVVDLHVPPGGRLENGEMAMFYDRRYADAFVTCWERIAARFRGNADVIYGYDLINEPEQNEPSACDYWELQRRAASAVRAIDPDTTIIVEANGWDAPDAFAYLGALDLDNVIYQVHMYMPFDYTHQRVGGSNLTPRAYPDRAAGLDLGRLRQYLQPVRDFERRHRAKIYVGEFSAVAWAAGADRYVADCIAIFNEYGWDWTYHAFREWPGWS
ncbi:MAG: glycoside hydrolase family 5 protein, partial [Kiritimatiellia bacterium]